MTLEDPFERINREMKWQEKASDILKELYNGSSSAITESDEEKFTIIKSMEYFMDHNQEKYRDREGIEYYLRIKSFIKNLE